MDKEDLDDIRERRQAITPGRWRYDWLEEKVYTDTVSICDVGKDWERDADGYFIAAAPEDIDALLAGVDALRDLLLSAVHGQQIVSMNGEHIARLVDGELVIETWRKG